MAPVALLMISGRRDPPLCVPAQDFFLANYKYNLIESNKSGWSSQSPGGQ